MDAKPFWMTHNFAPVAEEVTAFDLPVEGELPAELEGTFLRNGPNPRDGASPHWLVGSGMVHGIELGGGQARWYRNRYVEGRNNTHVIAHAGRILALVEARLPIELDRELGTIGPFDFGGAVDTAFTAHPKLCARTGELHFFGYQFGPPHITYYVADAAGRVLRRHVVEVEGASYLHDFALTEHHAVFFDTPARMTSDWGRGKLPFEWKEGHATRIGVVPRDGSGPARWFPISTCVLSHTANAFEEDGRITIDGIKLARLDMVPPCLHRWQIDLASGEVRETVLDPRPVDFPRIDERKVGLRHRYTYVVELRLKHGAPAGSLLRRHDSVTGESRACDLGDAQMPNECVLATGADPAEDAGWLLAFVYDADRHGSDLVVLDAREFGAPPVARVRLPQRVPFGFHGSWVPATAQP
ncbi:MAG TPA: carotenoid oxygenase family protein [Kofleriaceae bacterium]|nr:carotenoid oxygenase family protein [Kofleriaceae bacterium]